MESVEVGKDGMRSIKRKTIGTQLSGLRCDQCALRDGPAEAQVPYLPDTRAVPDSARNQFAIVVISILLINRAE